MSVSTASTTNATNRERLYNSLSSCQAVAVLVALCLAAINASAWLGLDPSTSVIAQRVVAALFVAWVAVLFWLRNSKERWLTIAIVLQGAAGLAIMVLPTLEMTVPDGLCSKVLDLGPSLNLAGMLFGLSATIWLAAGAWLTSNEVRGLEKIDKPSKWRGLITGFFKSAHQQISMGLLTAAFGAGAALGAVGVDIRDRHTGKTTPEVHACKAPAIVVR